MVRDFAERGGSAVDCEGGLDGRRKGCKGSEGYVAMRMWGLRNGVESGIPFFAILRGVKARLSVPWLVELRLHEVG